ncbi:hypothetical protein [Polaribacter sp. Asnod1-A03]|uniref:hypothetical protein n=1 Tax=Polaribacter sp. Asnod1-A03 TaxID=3160581 RepID=UPI003866A0DB
MKKLILTVTVIILTSSVSIFALEDNNNKVINEIAVVSVDDDFKEITIKELPAKVVDAILKDFSEATVTKVYVNTNDQYKIALTVDETERVVYADKKGEWLKKDEVIKEKVVSKVKM